MTEIKVGDRVRVKDRKGWPSPPGYALAKSEGTVVKWVAYDEVTEEFRNYTHVKIEKSAAKEYIGITVFIRVENLEKI
jgi:hypothetical protein